MQRRRAKFVTNLLEFRLHPCAWRHLVRAQAVGHWRDGAAAGGARVKIHLLGPSDPTRVAEALSQRDRLRAIHANECARGSERG